MDVSDDMDLDAYENTRCCLCIHSFRYGFRLYNSVTGSPNMRWRLVWKYYKEFLDTTINVNFVVCLRCWCVTKNFYSLTKYVAQRQWNMFKESEDKRRKRQKQVYLSRARTTSNASSASNASLAKEQQHDLQEEEEEELEYDEHQDEEYENKEEQEEYNAKEEDCEELEEVDEELEEANEELEEYNDEIEEYDDDQKENEAQEENESQEGADEEEYDDQEYDADQEENEEQEEVDDDQEEYEEHDESNDQEEDYNEEQDKQQQNSELSHRSSVFPLAPLECVYFQNDKLTLTKDAESATDEESIFMPTLQDDDDDDDDEDDDDVNDDVNDYDFEQESSSMLLQPLETIESRHLPTLNIPSLIKENVHVDDMKLFKWIECDKENVENKTIRSINKRRGDHEGIVRICKFCGIVLKNLPALKAHLNTHLNDENKLFACDICDCKLTSKSSLKRHKVTFHKDSTVYKCMHCGKHLKNMEALLRHKNYVHDERLFKCTICMKAFKYAHVLKDHMNTHTGNKINKCPHCPRSFTSRCNMYRHRKREHPKEWSENRNAQKN